MTKLTATCETCGKAMEFFPSQVRRYCSQRCMGLARSGRPRPPRLPSPINKVTSVCPVCGTAFTHWPGEKRTTCSRACLYKYLPMHRRAAKSTAISSKVTSVCAVCEQEFTHFPSQQRVTCSTTCAGIYRGRTLKGQKRGPYPAAKTGQVLTCVVCGTAFYARANEIRNGRKYCSQACKGVTDRKPRTIKPCAYCGKEMALTPSHLARVFCSRTCQSLGSVTSWTLLERTYNGRPVKQDTKGYIWVWAPDRARRAYGDAPSAATRGGALGGWYPEHRIVVEEALGYDLPADTHVHHVNGQKHDNRLANLVAMGHTEHLVLSGQERLAAIALALAELAEYRRRYGPLTDWPATAPVAPIASASSASAAAR